MNTEDGNFMSRAIERAMSLQIMFDLCEENLIRAIIGNPHNEWLMKITMRYANN